MKRLSACVIAAGVLSVTATPTTAHAATGQFHYTHAYTKLQVVLTDPPSGTCIQVTNNGCARNLTDRTATLYPSPACQGEALGTLSAGQSQALAFASVVFSSP
ncbi:hypothetical protein ACIQUU_17180 [Streptomyces sp. NPDC101116]|uniref:hypothetical protein n=1 Tax=Streptomyces sp. NPDC101116 TaxID=3366107 RepID=UPI0038059BF4